MRNKYIVDPFRNCTCDCEEHMFNDNEASLQFAFKCNNSFAATVQVRVLGKHTFSYTAIRDEYGMALFTVPLDDYAEYFKDWTDPPKNPDEDILPEEAEEENAFIEVGGSCGTWYRFDNIQAYYRNCSEDNPYRYVLTTVPDETQENVYRWEYNVPATEVETIGKGLNLEEGELTVAAGDGLTYSKAGDLKASLDKPLKFGDKDTENEGKIQIDTGEGLYVGKKGSENEGKLCATKYEFIAGLNVEIAEETDEQGNKRITISATGGGSGAGSYPTRHTFETVTVSPEEVSQDGVGTE